MEIHSMWIQIKINEHLTTNYAHPLYLSYLHLSAVLHSGPDKTFCSNVLYTCYMDE